MNYHQIDLYGSMTRYEESVEAEYNKLHEKSNKTNSEEKDNSMFGQEILKELGININESNEYENEENDLIR